MRPSGTKERRSPLRARGSTARAARAADLQAVRLGRLVRLVRLRLHLVELASSGLPCRRSSPRRPPCRHGRGRRRAPSAPRRSRAWKSVGAFSFLRSSISCAVDRGRRVDRVRRTSSVRGRGRRRVDVDGNWIAFSAVCAVVQIASACAMKSCFERRGAAAPAAPGATAASAAASESPANHFVTLVSSPLEVRRSYAVRWLHGRRRRGPGSGTGSVRTASDPEGSSAKHSSQVPVGSALDGAGRRAQGRMLWAKRKTFCGSYLRFTARSRA